MQRYTSVTKWYVVYKQQFLHFFNLSPSLHSCPRFWARFVLRTVVALRGGVAVTWARWIVWARRLIGAGGIVFRIWRGILRLGGFFGTRRLRGGFTYGLLLVNLRFVRDILLLRNPTFGDRFFALPSFFERFGLLPPLALLSQSQNPLSRHLSVWPNLSEKPNEIRQWRYFVLLYTSALKSTNYTAISSTQQLAAKYPHRMSLYTTDFTTAAT